MLEGFDLRLADSLKLLLNLLVLRDGVCRVTAPLEHAERTCILLLLMELLQFLLLAFLLEGYVGFRFPLILHRPRLVSPDILAICVLLPVFTTVPLPFGDSS